MAKKLVIVESPAKAKTIGGYLGKDYEVLASVGHIRDLLPNGSRLPEELKKKWWADYAVDIDNGFEPIYEVPSEKTAQVKKLREALKGKETLVLATDEDREGESISWHLREVLKPSKTVKVERIAFHEITKEAIAFAIQNPREVDLNLVQAQETRRVLDRLYGYTLSPVLWSRIERNLSAGRVQTPAVKLIVERERARMRFKGAKYWDLRATLSNGSQDFTSVLRRIDGTRLATSQDFDDESGELKISKEARLILSESEANELAPLALKVNPWTVTKIDEKEGFENPSPPFMTTTLQQDANRKFGFSAAQTMRIAQGLYEGIDLGGEQVGLITYMRTDSLTLSKAAIDGIRAQIKKDFPECLPDKPRTYASKVRNAQEAHEAIRATYANRKPSDIAKYLSSDQFKIYDLIWKRTLACQMSPARVLRTEATFDVKVQDKVLSFVSTGKQIIFEGFLKIYQESRDDSSDDNDKERRLPRLTVGMNVRCKRVEPESHETQPPLRFTEATLIKKLEDNGIGRPSTYATILTVIVDRGYVKKEGKSLVPTFTAFLTMDLLDQNFQEFTHIEFTKNMDDVLDEIADGRADSKKYLGDFFLGENGLKTAVDERRKDLPYPAFNVGLHPVTNEDIFVRLSKDGDPFLQLGPRENKKFANVPIGTVPSDLTIAKAIELFENKGSESESIGLDPVTGRRLLLKHRQGFYLEAERTQEEIEHKVKPRWISVPPGADPRDLSEDQLAFLCQLPSDIGKNPENKIPIQFKMGKFGGYIECGTERRTLTNWEEGMNLSVEQAMTILAQPKNASGRRLPSILKEFEAGADQNTIKVLSGRFGPYVTDGEFNATLPRGSIPSELTLAQAQELLQAKRAAGPAVKSSRWSSNTRFKTSGKGTKTVAKGSAAKPKKATASTVKKKPPTKAKAPIKPKRKKT